MIFIISFGGDLFTISLPGGKTIGISLLVLILIPSGIFFSVETKFLPIRMFKEMVRIAVEKKEESNEGAITGVQALIVSTATRVGMGNMVGVAAAAADVSHPTKAGLFQAFGVLIDTIIICTCTAMIMLLALAEVTSGLEGMALLQAAMNYHFGYVGVVFTTITLWFFFRLLLESYIMLEVMLRIYLMIIGYHKLFIRYSH